MHDFRKIEDMPSQIRAFFESKGKLELDDEETPSVCYLLPNDGSYKQSIAMTVSELKWISGGFLDGNYNKLCEGLSEHEWLYWGVDDWVSEKEMLRLLKIKVFW